MRYVKLRYRKFLYIFLYLIVTVFFSFSSASEYYPTFLNENKWKEEDYYDALPPGDYLIDVIVDLIHLTKTIPLYVESKKNRDAVYYCLRKIDLVKAGIDFTSIEDDRFESNKLRNDDCIEPQSMFDGVQFYIRHQDMTGYLKIPEKYQHTKSTNKFSYGDSALFAKYDSYIFIDDSNMDFNAGLQFGINHSRWQIRHNGSYSEGKYNHTRLYMRTYLEDISSQLLLGTVSAKVGLNEHIPFHGLYLFSEQELTEDGVSPSCISGFAETRAKVTILKAGNITYEDRVPPGYFCIDLAMDSSDTELVVEESNGRIKRSFIFPNKVSESMFSKKPKGFDIGLGEYNGHYVGNKVPFVSGSYSFEGTKNITTHYGGILSKKYLSLYLENNAYYDMGSFSASVAASDAAFLNGHYYGVVGRYGYGKKLPYIGTNLGVSFYRNLWGEYYKFSDISNQIKPSIDNAKNNENRLDVFLNHKFESSSLAFNGSFGLLNNDRKIYQLGYTKHFSWGDINLKAIQSETRQSHNNSLALNIIVPFGGQHSTIFRKQLIYNSDGRLHSNVSLSGKWGDNEKYSYGFVENRKFGKYASNSRSIEVGYNGALTNLKAGMSQNHNHNIDGHIFANGTVVAVNNNVYLTNLQDDTLAIVTAKGAEGTIINHNGEHVVKNNGIIALPIMPYKKANLHFEHENIEESMLVNTQENNIKLHRGSIKSMDFTVNTKTYSLFKIKNKEIPLGAGVFDEHNQMLTMVGQGNLVYIDNELPFVNIIWGGSDEEQCKIKFLRNINQNSRDIWPIDITCS